MSIGILIAFVAIAASIVLSLRWRKQETARLALENERVLAEHAKVTAERERLLQVLLETIPMAVVLFTGGGRILFTNQTAKDLFFDGEEPEGGNFLNRLGRAPEALRRAILGEGDELFSIYDDNLERHTYHLAKRHFDLGDEPVVLVVVNNLRRELRRQEVEVYKKLFRVLSHELNNSLAPITSLMYSGRALIRETEEEKRLTRLFDTVAERADHLRSFIGHYAELARLPAPRKTETALGPFVERLLSLLPEATLDGEMPTGVAWLDAAQIEQALINLLKNAIEVDRDVVLRVELGAQDVRFGVLDRGPGMSPEVLKNALLPFFSTKENGSGLGLPIATEIVEAHGGVLRLQLRDGGGLEAWVRLPVNVNQARNYGKLTLTRS